MADAPATIGHDIDVPADAHSLQELESVPSPPAEYICHNEPGQARSSVSTVIFLIQPNRYQQGYSDNTQG